MMSERAGRILTKRYSPHIYFIRKDRFLYIGETQRNPVFRWSEHLTEEGSFQKALIKRDEDIYLSDLSIEFFAYRCTKIESDVGLIDRRRVTQFVEHALHVKAICTGLRWELISDTTQTAPAVCKYDWVDELVDDIYSSFLTDAQGNL
jgi:hypothetical protein